MIQQTCKYVSSSLCPCFNTSSVTFYSILHQRKVLRMRSFYILLAIGVTFLLAIETRGQFKLSDMENHPHSQYRLRESEETRRKFYVSLPYIKGTSQRLQRAFNLHQVTLLHKPFNSLTSQLFRV